AGGQAVVGEGSRAVRILKVINKFRRRPRSGPTAKTVLQKRGRTGMVRPACDGQGPNISHMVTETSPGHRVQDVPEAVPDTATAKLVKNRPEDLRMNTDAGEREPVILPKRAPVVVTVLTKPLTRRVQQRRRTTLSFSRADAHSRGEGLMVRRNNEANVVTED